MRWQRVLVFTFVVVVQVTLSAAEAQDRIQVKSATYGFGSSSTDVTAKMQELCDGKVRCNGRLVGMFPDVAKNKPKVLHVQYNCGTSSNESATIYEPNVWRLTCPGSQQPNTRVDYWIDKEGTAGQGTFDLMIPAGYNYCFHHKYDWSKVGSDSDATEIKDGNGAVRGIHITWKLAPASFPFGGGGSIHHLWSIFAALPGEDCPPSH